MSIPGETLTALNPEQLRILGCFREAVKDIPHLQQSDWLLERYLRARDFKLSKAEAMLRKAIQLQESLGLVGALCQHVELPAALKCYFPTVVSGVTPRGSPILWHRAGRVDTEGPLDTSA